MRAFLAVLAADYRSRAPWAAIIALSAACALTGPFGSYGAFTHPERALFWTPVISLLVVIGSVTRAVVYGPLGLCGTARGVALVTLLNSALVSPPLYLFFNWALPMFFTGWASLVEIGLLVFLFTLGICILRGEDADAPVAAGTQVLDPEAWQPRLMRRLPAQVHGRLWAITVRDHYVDVLTDSGKASLLMRFSDAIAEVDGVPGAQVHRSHWVAWAGVGSVCREGGKVILHLKNGHQIPVSRNHRDKVDGRFPSVPCVRGAAA